MKTPFLTQSQIKKLENIQRKVQMRGKPTDKEVKYVCNLKSRFIVTKQMLKYHVIPKMYTSSKQKTAAQKSLNAFSNRYMAFCKKYKR